MNLDDDESDDILPTCVKCGIKIYPPGQRPWGTDWYCTCSVEQADIDAQKQHYLAAKDFLSKLLDDGKTQQ